MDEIEPILQRARRRTVWIAAVGAVVVGIVGAMLARWSDSPLAGALAVIGFMC